VNGKGLRRRLSEQKLFVIVLSVSGLVGRGQEKDVFVARYSRGHDEAGLTFDTQQLARAGLRNRRKQVRHKRKKVFKSVARRNEQDNSDSRSGEVLLKL